MIWNPKKTPSAKTRHGRTVTQISGATYVLTGGEEEEDDDEGHEHAR